MPAWITLTIADLQAARHAELVDAVQRKAKAIAQPDPIPAAITKIVNEMRAVIAFSGRYSVDEDTATIAPNLVDLCVQKIARVLMPRIGRALSDDEKAEEKVYQKRLEDLRDGTWPVDEPATPAAESPVTVRRPRPSITPRDRYFTNCDERGI